MGATGGESYVQLGLAPDMTEADLAALADGMAAVAASAGIAIVGGDIVRSPTLFVAVTVVGHADAPSDFITRGGAQAGDVLVLTGPLGGAAAGLVLLERPELGAGLPDSVAEALRARQQEPVARLGAGRLLARCGATAMIDLSDGLAGDAAHLAQASSVRLVIDAERVPVAAGIGELPAAVDRDRLILSGGEDYELLAALPPDRADETLSALVADGLNPAVIGRVETGEGLVLRSASGREITTRGYDQIRFGAPGEPT